MEKTNLKNNWINPFSVDRVEGWRPDEYPENYIKIATSFSPPDFMSKLEDHSITKAIFIVGAEDLANHISSEKWQFNLP